MADVFDRIIKETEDVARKDILASAIQVPTTTRKFSGQARVNTRVGINTINGKVELAVPYTKNYFTPAIGISVRAMRAAMRDFKAGDTVYVTNSLYYARFLEAKDGMFQSAIKGLTS